MDQNDIENFKFLNFIIEENDILVDVGANDGHVYTKYFLNKIKNTGKVYAIELDNNNVERIKNNLQKDNLIVINKAVSNVDGYIDYYKGVSDHTNNILGHDVWYNSNNKIGQIESIRLDTLLKEEKSVKLIKIDVEGAELLVLEGISGIIEKVQNILVECHFDEDWGKIKKILIDDFKLNCYNITNGDNNKITQTSTRPYQCLCKNENK